MLEKCLIIKFYSLRQNFIIAALIILCCYEIKNCISFRYPFYGVQFHPEKSAFEWKRSKSYAHSQNAIKANRYFMDFFVQECSKNIHHFENDSEENEYLIYNYSPTFTGAHGSAYSQCYFFEPRGTVSKL